MPRAMPPSSSSSVDFIVSETRWADQAASRLRLIMSICADESTEKRHASIEEEIRRQLKEVPPAKRKLYLDELAAKFPTWQRIVEAGDAAPAEPGPIETADEMLQFLGRVSPHWSVPDRERLRARLTELELIEPVKAGSDEKGDKHKQQDTELTKQNTELTKQGAELTKQSAEFKQQNSELTKQNAELAKQISELKQQSAELMQQNTELTHEKAEPKQKPNKTVDSDRLTRLCAQQEEFLVKLDQLVWNTWKILAPKSALKRDASLGDLRTLVRHYLRGDAEPSDQQMVQQIERTRQLIAVLMGSMSQISRGFAKRYQTRYAPDAVKDLVKLEGGGRLLTSADTRYWRKYSELAAEITEAGIQSDMQDVIVRYVEELMRGAPRGNT